MGEGARALAAAVLAAVLAAGCAAASLEPGAEPERRAEPERERPDQVLARGLAALDTGAFAAAKQDLVRVYAQCWRRAEGRQALLALAAAELDPRNPARSPAAAARLAAEYLRLEREPGWSRPIATALYLAALDATPATVAGAAAADSVSRAEAVPAGPEPGSPAEPLVLEGCEPVTAEALAVDTMAPELPGLPGAGMAARLVRLELQRDSLAARVAELERQLAGLQEELARIRKTLKP